MTDPSREVKRGDDPRIQPVIDWLYQRGWRVVPFDLPATSRKPDRTTNKKGITMDNPMIGKNVLIRTVTHYYTGQITMEGNGWIVLVDAAWIADTGRFSNALATGQLSEVEPYPDGEVWVNAGAVVDLCEWSHPLPRTVK